MFSTNHVHRSARPWRAAALVLLNDGNSVYGTTQFQFYRTPSGATGPSWVTFTSKSTPEHAGAGVARVTSLQVGLRGDADRARGVTKACAQMGWPVPDSCSTSAFLTFSY
jgi:hypothetical protein